MLDIRLLRDDPDAARRGLESRRADASVVDRVLELDARRRELIARADEIKARRNELNKSIPRIAREGGDIAPLKEESKALGEEVKGLDDALKEVEEGQRDLLLSTPNLPDASTPVGASEDDNVVVREAGAKPAFDFAPKPHWELGTELGILELDRGTKISGSGFYALKGAGARLERALLAWLLDTATTRNGYTELAVPFLVNRATMTGTGQLPKFEDDAFKTEGDDLFLIPTAEVPVTNLHAGEILEEDHLPVKYCAATPCFRREAGGYGKENRGISRVHQFNKVELVQLVRPEDSAAAHEELTGHATGLLDALGLPYRVVELCTADIGFSAAKCYDLEVWAPGMDRFLEVSSCSNFGDFQARRANLRFRRAEGGKPEFVHTLNGSGLALPRLMIALLENGQRADGSIALPTVLHGYFGAEEIR